MDKVYNMDMVDIKDMVDNMDIEILKKTHGHLKLLVDTSG
jgi:hypothetical protein